MCTDVCVCVHSCAWVCVCVCVSQSTQRISTSRGHSYHRYVSWQPCSNLALNYKCLHYNLALPLTLLFFFFFKYSMCTYIKRLNFKSCKWYTSAAVLWGHSGSLSPQSCGWSPVRAEPVGVAGRAGIMGGCELEGLEEGGCSSAFNPTWSHWSWRVYQAKAAWSLNAHAANLFNYSPSSLAF